MAKTAPPPTASPLKNMWFCPCPPAPAPCNVVVGLLFSLLINCVILFLYTRVGCRRWSGGYLRVGFLWHRPSEAPRLAKKWKALHQPPQVENGIERTLSFHVSKPKRQGGAAITLCQQEI